MSIPYYLKPNNSNIPFSLNSLDIEKDNLGFFCNSLSSNDDLKILKNLVKKYLESIKEKRGITERKFINYLNKINNSPSITLVKYTYYEIIFKHLNIIKIFPFHKDSKFATLDGFNCYGDLVKYIENEHKLFTDRSESLLKSFESMFFSKNEMLKELKIKSNERLIDNTFNRLILRIEAVDVSYVLKNIFSKFIPEKCFTNYFDNMNYIILPFENTYENYDTIKYFINQIDENNSYIYLYKPHEKIPFIFSLNMSDFKTGRAYPLIVNNTSEEPNGFANYGDEYSRLKSIDYLYEEVCYSKNPTEIDIDKHIKPLNLVYKYDKKFENICEQLGFSTGNSSRFAQKQTKVHETFQKKYYTYHKKPSEKFYNKHLHTDRSLSLLLKPFSSILQLDIDFKLGDSIKTKYCPPEIYFEYFDKIGLSYFYGEQAFLKESESKGLHLYFKFDRIIDDCNRDEIISQLIEGLEEYLQENYKEEGYKIYIDNLNSKSTLKTPLSDSYYPLNTQENYSLFEKIDLIEKSLINAKINIINKIFSKISPCIYDGFEYMDVKLDSKNVIEHELKKISKFVENPESITKYLTVKGYSLEEMALERMKKAPFTPTIDTGHRFKNEAHDLGVLCAKGYSRDKAIDYLKEKGVTSKDIRKWGWDKYRRHLQRLWGTFRDTNCKVTNAELKKSETYIPNTDKFSFSKKERTAILKHILKSPKRINSLPEEINPHNLNNNDKFLSKISQAIDLLEALHGHQAYRIENKYSYENSKCFNKIDAQKYIPFDKKTYKLYKEYINNNKSKTKNDSKKEVLFEILKTFGLIKEISIYKDSKGKEYTYIHNLYKDQSKVTETICKHYEILDINLNEKIERKNLNNKFNYLNETTLEYLSNFDLSDLDLLEILYNNLYLINKIDTPTTCTLCEPISIATDLRIEEDSG